MRRKLGTVAVVVAIAVQLDAQSVDHAPAPPTPPWGTPASDWAPETGLMHFDPDPNGIASRFTGVDDLLGVGADLAFGGEVEAQYYGEWMAAPPTLPPLTESMDYDIHGDAKTARALQEASTRTARLESFKTAVNSINLCVPFCAVAPVTGVLYARPSQMWVPLCVANCFLQATHLLPDNVYAWYRQIPRSGPGHSSHPTLLKRLERLLRRR